MSDDAVRRACYVVRFLLADHYDIRNAFYKNFGRFGVIGRNEAMTDIPEQRFLETEMDGISRGYGATL